MQNIDLVLAQRCTRVSHHILYATLVHGNHIGITFHHIHAIFLHNGFLCLEDAIQLTLFMENFRIGRIDILLCNTFSARVEQSPAKGYHLATQANPRKDYTSCITIRQLSVFSFIANSCSLDHRFFSVVHLDLGFKRSQVLLVESLSHCSLGKSITLRQGKA